MTTDVESPAPAGTRRDRLTFVRIVVLLLLYATVAGFAVSEFIRFPGLGNVSSALGGEDFFGDMVYGRAPQPYVTRVLVPWLIRGAVVVTPQTVRDRVAQNVRATMTTEGKPEWLYGYPFEFTMAKNIILLFAVGFAFALWWLARLVLDAPAPAVDVIPVAVLFALPGMYGHASHLYDFPALCLFTLGLALIAARRRWLYLLVFVAATLNKETALMLTLVWAVSGASRLSRRHLMSGIVLQLAVWGFIRGGLWLLFRHNPGEAVALHLPSNLQVLGQHDTWFRFRTVADWLVLPTGFNVLYLLGFLTSLYALRGAPRFLKDAFWVAVPIFLLTLLFGKIDEVRVYYELLPVVVLALFSGLYRLMGYGPRSQSSASVTT
ncbi:MAG TPA: hypothetical protein VMH22_05815 [bacterium]|nr:hypothetical protein [bacterium]